MEFQINQLRDKIDLVAPALSDRAGRLFSHSNLTYTFPSYLCTLHAIIRASVPLMKAALSRSQSLEGNSETCRHLSRYLETHIQEELHHDDWLLEDLEVLGVSREDVLRRCPPPSIAALVGAQYYWIAHHHPLTVIGYIAVMEGSPPTQALIDHLRQATGFPASAFRTLTKHATIDLFHKADLDRFLSMLSLNAQEEAMIGLSAFYTVGGLVDIFDEMLLVDSSHRAERAVEVI